MSKYQLPEIEPFWSENKGFMTGRDPLGIQNSSITVYGRLLPGLTNLTQRIRYYGFYCWLLHKYDAIKPSEIKSIQHHYTFLRRAELIMSFLMVNIDSKHFSVVGSNYATKYQSDIDKFGHYDIIKGADRYNNDGNELYWDFSSGALGQYYAGAMTSLGLIEIIEGFYHIRENGIILAECFGTNVTKIAAEHFLLCIQNGTLSRQDIEKVRAFTLNEVGVNSKEMAFYKDMLLQEDGTLLQCTDGKVPMKRRQTIGLFLKYKQSQTYQTEFPEWIYNIKPKDVEVNSAFFGWYYYYLLEAMHFSFETIFWSMLTFLEGNITSTSRFRENVKDYILTGIEESYNIQATDTVENLIIKVDQDISKNFNELQKLIKKPLHKVAAYKAVTLLCSIYIETLANNENFEIFENLNKLNEQKGIISKTIKLYIEKNLTTQISEFVDKIIAMIMDDHILTAYRKMGNSELSLIKFNIEDNIICHIQTMAPKRTTPRLRPLEFFLKDLQLLENGKPTENDINFNNLVEA